MSARERKELAALAKMPDSAIDTSDIPEITDDDGTHVRAASYGYGTDEESVAMRRFFEAGNQQTIDTLRRHFGTPAQ